MPSLSFQTIRVRQLMDAHRKLGISSLIGFADGPGVDAFGRVRTGQPVTLFSSTSEYDANPLYFDTLLTGTGAVAHVPNVSVVDLSTGGALANAQAVYQSKAYLRYQPGKSQQITITAVFGAAATNVRRRIGYFDGLNGVFFEQTSAGISVVQRSASTGVAVDTAVAQAQWNIDPLNGRGGSGITVDLSKAQIFHIDLQWLGMGRVRMGFVIDGVLFYCHEFLNANNLSVPYMSTGSLPVRAEITNTGVAAGSSTLRFGCCSVQSEGGFEPVASIPVLSGRTALVATGTGGVVHVAIRPKTTFNGRVNRGQIFARNIVTVAGGDGYWILWHNLVVNGGAWASAGANSIAEVNLTAVGITTPGIPVDYGYLSGPTAAKEQASHLAEQRLPLCLGADGTTQPQLALVLYSFAATPNMAGGLNWEEFR